VLRRVATVVGESGGNEVMVDGGGMSIWEDEEGEIMVDVVVAIVDDAASRMDDEARDDPIDDIAVGSMSSRYILNARFRLFLLLFGD